MTTEDGTERVKVERVEGEGYIDPTIKHSNYF